MIIDLTQNRDGVDISYVDDNKQIQVLTAPLKYGYYRYVKAEPFDHKNLLVDNLKSFKNNDLIKREQAKYFDKHNINEYLNHELKVEYPDIFSKVSKLLIPNPFSVDIETDITDETGYSTAELAENKILSISITDVNLKTLIFVLENEAQPTFSEIDKLNIQSHIENSLGSEYTDQYEFPFEIRVFNSEVDMLNVFLECINKFFHSIFGWNFTTYDWLYIWNRCENLGIDLKKASPVYKTFNKKFKVRKGAETSINIKMPTHRIINDYMTFFKQSLIYNNLGNYSLNSISEMILGLKKVMYDGNLRTLYQQDFNKFIAYAIMDTILVMLIHLKTNLYSVDYFESYFNGIAYQKISQNAISEALVYNELRADNMFLLESEFNVSEKQSYEGGYVKLPIFKIIQAGIGVDFSGLYPNSIITIGISPERKIDKITVDKNGIPVNDSEMNKWLSYKKQNCSLSPLGNVYSLANGDGLYVRIEKKLIKQRKVFKGHAEEIYLDILTRIDNRITELESA